MAKKAPKRRAPSRARALAGAGLVLLLKVLATLVVVAIPLLGVWAATSLATYADGPVWAAVVAGLFLFPVGPLLWDGLHEVRRRREERPPERILTFWDRLVARTFVVNLVFLGGFLLGWPEAIFTALSTRGDWMLEHAESDAATSAREALLSTADGLAWLYESAHDNPFAPEEPGPESPIPTPAPGPGASPSSPEPRTAEGGGAATRPGRAPPAWPMEASLHPAVRDMPPEVETSVASVARYIAEREPDPWLRVKAIHDYVADRVAYDAIALANGAPYPPQDADTVLRTRKGVCAGYARLVLALGRAINIDVVYVHGDARKSGDDVDGASHAWNAVRIEGGWYLLDATWDAGSVDGRTFEKRYRTSYLWTPPEVFGLDHFPTHERWQLRDEPISRGEFNRQPMMRPAFYASGFELIAPDRSQVTVDESLRVTLGNPRGRFVLASHRPRGTDRRTDCDVVQGARVEVTCRLPSPGRFEVLLFDNAQRFGSYAHIGRVEVIRR